MAQYKIIGSYVGDNPLVTSSGGTMAVKSLTQEEYSELLKNKKTDPNTIYYVWSSWKVKVAQG